MLLLEVLQVLVRSRDRGTAALLRPKYVRAADKPFHNTFGHSTAGMHVQV